MSYVAVIWLKYIFAALEERESVYRVTAVRKYRYWLWNYFLWFHKNNDKGREMLPIQTQHIFVQLLIWPDHLLLTLTVNPFKNNNNQCCMQENMSCVAAEATRKSAIGKKWQTAWTGAWSEIFYSVTKQWHKALCLAAMSHHPSRSIPTVKWGCSLMKGLVKRKETTNGAEKRQIAEGSLL